MLTAQPPEHDFVKTLSDTAATSDFRIMRFFVFQRLNGVRLPMGPTTFQKQKNNISADVRQSSLVALTACEPQHDFVKTLSGVWTTATFRVLRKKWFPWIFCRQILCGSSHDRKKNVKKTIRRATFLARSTHGAAATALFALGDFQLEIHDNSDKWRFERVRIHCLFLVERAFQQKYKIWKRQKWRKWESSQKLN